MPESLRRSGREPDPRVPTPAPACSDPLSSFPSVASRGAAIHEPLALASALAARGEQLYREGDHPGAEQALAHALQLRETAGADPLGLIAALNALATVHAAQGNIDRAEPLLTRALATADRLLGPDHPDVAYFLNNLAHLLFRQRQYERAEPLLRRLLVMKEALGLDHPEVVGVLASLAMVHEGAGRPASARSLWRRVLAIREKTLAPDAPAIAHALEHLADTCAIAGDLDEAFTHLERALVVRGRSLGPAHPSLAVVRAKIAGLHLGAGTHAHGRSTPAPSRPVAHRGPLVLSVPPTASRPDEPVGPRAPARPSRPVEPAHRSPVDALQAIERELAAEQRPGTNGGGSGRLRALVPAPSRPLAVDDDEDEYDLELTRPLESEEPASRFDLLSDAAWPKTRLALGVIVLAVVSALGATLALRGDGRTRSGAATAELPAGAVTPDTVTSEAAARLDSPAVEVPTTRNGSAPGPASRGDGAPSVAPSVPPPSVDFDDAMRRIDNSSRISLDTLNRATRNSPVAPRGSRPAPE
ncbi:MAG: tetratricopeptide repeat protein [Gemmatimonadota bacterium]|nr:tetratricopeptide repeat protein [Gemmatimonadota bacterium]